MIISGKIDESITDGVGIRTVIFYQGCPHHCKGCHNEGTWSYEGGYEADVGEIVETIKSNPIIRGVTFSGGEPFSERNYASMLEIIEQMEDIGRDIWVYTGYTLEELESKVDKRVDRILSKVDVVVDGVYEESKRNLELKFRGSSNQRVIEMKEYRAEKIQKKEGR